MSMLSTHSVKLVYASYSFVWLTWWCTKFFFFFSFFPLLRSKWFWWLWLLIYQNTWICIRYDAFMREMTANVMFWWLVTLSHSEWKKKLRRNMHFYGIRHLACSRSLPIVEEAKHALKMHKLTILLYLMCTCSVDRDMYIFVWEQKVNISDSCNLPLWRKIGFVIGSQ